MKVVTTMTMMLILKIVGDVLELKCYRHSVNKNNNRKKKGDGKEEEKSEELSTLSKTQ